MPWRTLVPFALIGALTTMSPYAGLAGEPSGAANVAVIVNRANTSPDPSFQDLRAVLNLEQQFWGDGKRVVLILPPAGSDAKNLLLDKIYHRTDAQLRKDWARRLFAGEIPAVPTSLRTAASLVSAVERSPGAIAVVPAGTPVPPSVRILAVDGKRPGEPGYALSADGS